MGHDATDQEFREIWDFLMDLGGARYSPRALEKARKEVEKMKADVDKGLDELQKLCAKINEKIAGEADSGDKVVDTDSKNTELQH
ncbi:hypothetical protein SGCOL_005926 [Colletotrichum sp. CLE4]